jgi:predicted signal transduction protein with EAL and GGDEF domain
MQATRFVPRIVQRWFGLRRWSTTTLSVATPLADIRASEYLRVGASTRFRAVQRDRTRAASRVGFLIIAAAAVFDGIAVFDPHVRDRRRAVDRRPDNVPFGVATISLGAVWLTPSELDQSDDEWFARADAALYQAKKLGRNRVRIARS